MSLENSTPSIDIEKLHKSAMNSMLLISSTNMYDNDITNK